jgi:hypothetical protein
VTVPNNPVASIRQLQAFHRREKAVNFSLNRLLQLTTRSGAQQRRRRIIDDIRLTKGNDFVIFAHGASLLIGGSGRLVTCLDTPPHKNRHHPDSAIALQRQAGVFKIGILNCSDGVLNSDSFSAYGHRLNSGGGYRAFIRRWRAARTLGGIKATASGETSTAHTCSSNRAFNSSIVVIRSRSATTRISVKPR